MTLCVNLAGGHSVHYIDETAVAANIQERGFAGDAATSNLERSDLTTHIYEGGFKVWECSIDLCEYLREHCPNLAGKRVLELGCGAGFPSIVAAQLGASLVVLQDFNECVLRCFTADNLKANGFNDIEADERFKLVSGGWTELGEKVPAGSFDLILTSETIYNEADYAALHDAIASSLSPDGVCLLAAKFFYFGVGGCVPSFMQFVESRGLLSCSECLAINASVPRRILQLRRKQ